MKISLNVRIMPEKVHTSNGYGYATDRMLASLRNLGYEVTYNDPKADVGIFFDQPHHWKFYGNQYRIGYHPWESTLLMPGWADIMNEEVDEVWTPSPLIAQWYTDYAGVVKPVYVYEHGVDPVWSEVDRSLDGPMKFLHVGAEASRKGARETMHCFRRAFGYNKDVALTMKIISRGWNVGAMRGITVVNERYDLDQLISMYHNHHAYVYPSWGEGFGLTPLQAMATGMPTITVPEWAPYRDFLDPNLAISSKFWPSPWSKIHPGKMLKPSEDDIVAGYRYVYNNYDEVSTFAHSQVEKLRKHYDWDRLTKECFESLENRLETLAR